MAINVVVGAARTLLQALCLCRQMMLHRTKRVITRRARMNDEGHPFNRKRKFRDMAINSIAPIVTMNFMRHIEMIRKTSHPDLPVVWRSTQDWKVLYQCEYLFRESVVRAPQLAACSI